MKLFSMPIAAAILFALAAGGWGAAPEGPLFEEIDVDKSGTISSDEFINAPLGFKETKDGKRLLQKLAPARGEKGGAGCIPLTAVEKQKLFDSLDKDKNKAVDRKEWLSFRDGKFIFF